VSPDGEMIYILNAGNQRIDRFERDGTFVGVWDDAVDPALGLSWNVNQGGTGLTVADDGLIYIADTWNHTVIVVDENGTVVRQLGQRGVLTDTTDAGDPGDSPGLFFGPRGIAVTNERIFVTDTGNERVQVFAKDGTFLNAFGGFGSRQGQFIEPTGIIIGPDGNVWVADSGNARIQVFTIEGEFLEEIPIPSWTGQMGVDRLNAIALGPDGVVYITSPTTGTIEAYAGGELVTVPGVGFVRAGGISVTPDGQLLVTDVNAGVVYELTPELPEGFGGIGPASSPAATPQATPDASPAASPAVSPASD
jgi:sugar lactone lactonase YvrE